LYGLVAGKKYIKKALETYPPCHSRESGNPEHSEKTGFPPEFTLAKAGAGMTTLTKCGEILIT
jgi:hypothetical protein